MDAAKLGQAVKWVAMRYCNYGISAFFDNCIQFVTSSTFDKENFCI